LLLPAQEKTWQIAPGFILLATSVGADRQARIKKKPPAACATDGLGKCRKTEARSVNASGITHAESV
jgi:hypothetical protein